jgi:cobalt-zinc-cadmium efflux system membrane fusion protein
MYKQIIYISFTMLIMATALGCSPAVEPSTVERFRVTDSLIKKLLIDTVQQANAQSELSFSAKIIANEDQQALIYPMVSGTVTTVPVRIGDYVKKGQLLASLSSAEMAGFEKDLVSARADLSISKRNVENLRQLYNSGLASSKELEEAQHDFSVKEAELKRTASVLKLNGGSRSGNYAITSPISGYIVEKRVNSNMQLRPDNDNPIFAIADLSKVSALINIYESDIPKIKEGDDVQLTLLSYPDRAFTGKINKIYNLLDAESKVINARVSIENPDLILKPGMLATARINSRSNIDLPVVRSRGIIFDDNRNYVLTLDSASNVKVKEVQISRKTAGLAYISKGLDAGERIIASKQVFIYESLKN